jgi:hypothetical protein
MRIGSTSLAVTIGTIHDDVDGPRTRAVLEEWR